MPRHFPASIQNYIKTDTYPLPCKSLLCQHPKHRQQSLPGGRPSNGIHPKEQDLYPYRIKSLRPDSPAARHLSHCRYTCSAIFAIITGGTLIPQTYCTL